MRVAEGSPVAALVIVMDWAAMSMTEGFLIAVVVVVLAYDLFALQRWGIEATVSRVITDWSRRHPVIPFLLGLVAGHWFWR